MKVHSHIYQLSDDTGTRYIGQTISGLVKRRNDHISEALRGKMTHKDKWIRLAISRGVDIHISEIESGLWTQEERDEREIYWIAEYRKQGVSLTNSTLGGFGHIPDESEKQYISLKTREAMARPEIRAKIKKLIPKNCLHCDKTFEPRRNRDKACSWACGQALATLSRTGKSRVDRDTICRACGSTFERNRPRQITCNTTCAGILRGEQTTKPYPDGVCISCGNTYSRSRNNRARKTCSESCRYAVAVQSRKQNG